ncbi:MAG: DUF5606 domain-containing protein [Bacteroidaceae bacterium]|nr:hypothetical protein [Bacteroidales bacterium]MBQ8695033.1 DUF5606 domain-containing protein [Bacteroidaceae bacterium]MBR3616796.1 DUF5606 domain-containing protein [Bacteroidaceae bacterium]
MFERILTISGKPGLYQLLSQGRNMFIVESVDATKKRMPVYNSDKVVMLDDIAIYTDTEEVPLREVFAKIYEKENAVLSFDTKSATPEELVEYFESVMPDYDRERVYLTHIKKIYSWYNILVANGVVDFAKSEDAAEESAE